LLALKNAEEEQTHAADAVAETPTISEDPKIAEEQTIAAGELQAEQQEPAPALSKKADDGEIVRKSEARAKSGGVPTGAVHRSMVLDSILIKGRVLSAEDGEGLPGVNVIVKGTSSGTVTDATGNYELPVPARNTSLVFSFLGFKSEEVRVTGQAELDVALDEDVSSLSEVIVTGRGDRAQAEGTYSAPEPQTGKSDFKTYLENTIVYPAQAIRSKTEGKVTVRFTIEPSGQLTGFEILKGIGSGCDEELIRVIREGPAWKPAKRGERAIADKVKVRHKFELPR
jgi:TonB family protein